LLGHAHLDLAWLWPVSETWNAAVNTFESVLSLQADFPELIFCHSTPALYALEIARRWELSPVFPKLEFTTSEKYLQLIKSQSQNLPVWENELYLEFHRGCYTTHADQKLWNRKSENLLYEAELFATLANVICGVRYPHTEIEAAWKQVLFNQFHDILPGTSITQVYEDALTEWEQVEQVGNRILDHSLRAIASHLILPQPPQPNSIPIIIFNSLNWQRSETEGGHCPPLSIITNSKFSNLRGHQKDHLTEC
jgi:alpha-mannosidase